MNKKIVYYIVVLVFIASSAAVFFIYGNITAKEKKISSSINTKLSKLKNIQINIDKNIKGIKRIELPVLRFGYSFNGNESYFISEIIKAGKKYGIKLSYVKLTGIKKNNNTANFYFKTSGFGTPAYIYSFIKDLEYNYKINLKKIYISKNYVKNDVVSFSSILAVYAISKPEMLSNIAKLKSKIVPPGNFGTINPFVYLIKKKKKKVVVAENVYKKLAHSSAMKESGFYNKKGVLFFERNDFDSALSMFKKAVKLNPDNYRALSNAALDEYEIKNYGGSIFYAKKALMYKKLWQIHFILGLSYMRLKMFPNAEYNFKEALELNPSNGKIKYYLNISKNRR